MMRQPHIRILAFAMYACVFCYCSESTSQRRAPQSAGLAVRDAGSSVPNANRNATETRQNALTIAVSRVSPAVVGINVTQIQRFIERSPFSDDPFWGLFFQPREYERRVKGLGSGFIISSEGHILTNEHVIENAMEIIITTTDKKQYTANVVGKDFLLDVALLKINGHGFPFIPLGNSDSVLIGEWAIALGNPFGLFNVNSKPTVTVGVVSATGLDFQGELKIEGRSYEGMIQTDAAINGGNSGGPLVNCLGECIGINTFIISGSDYQKTSIGIGFAIPINRVRTILPDLKRAGRVERPAHLGFRFRNLTAAEAVSRGISTQDGVIITAVVAGSSAAEMGLNAGDVVVAFDGNPVHSEDDIAVLIEDYQKRNISRFTITLFRRGRLYEATLPFERG